MKERNIDIKHNKTKKANLAKHLENTKYQVFLDDVRIITKFDYYVKRKIKESMEIEKNINNSIERIDY